MLTKTNKILLLVIFLFLIGIGATGFSTYNQWGNWFFEKQEEEKTERQKQKLLLLETVDLPDSFDLDIPFFSQAPLGNWSSPFDHACEEASILTVHYYLQDMEPSIEKVAQDIIDIVEFEEATYGFSEDTSAEQTAQLVEDYFGYSAVVHFDVSLQDVKKMLFNGYPVIIPTAGRELGNPFFTAPGPLLHMLVIKGYTSSGFVVNDVGTRRGANYVYSYLIIEKALHDWGNGNVKTGRPAMIVVTK